MTWRQLYFVYYLKPSINKTNNYLTPQHISPYVIGLSMLKPMVYARKYFGGARTLQWRHARQVAMSLMTQEPLLMATS